MASRKLSIIQKKTIFIIGMGLLFLATVLSVYILDLYTNSDNDVSNIFIDFLAIYIGICIGSIIQNTSRNKKTISIFLGAVFILLIGWFFDYSVYDATSSLLGYFISYWLANMFSKVDIFGLYSTKKKEDDNLDEKRDRR